MTRIERGRQRRRKKRMIKYFLIICILLMGISIYTVNSSMITTLRLSDSSNIFSANMAENILFGILDKFMKLVKFAPENIKSILNIILEYFK